MAAKVLRATSGAAWRALRTQGVPIELPSGHIAHLRPVAPEALVAQGEILDILTPLVTQMLFQGVDASADAIAQVLGGMMEADDGADPAQLRAAATNLAHLEQVCDQVCRAAFVDPRIVDDPQADDEIALADLDLTDKVHVFTLALRGAAALQHFRAEPPADVEPVPDRQGDEQPAQ
jgi:hypothetical protein